MYLDSMLVKNMGPIQNFELQPSFSEEGRPKPIVLVGKNGAGKSIALSNIVDALHELGQQSFNDIAVPMGSGGYKYYKVDMGAQIKLGQDSLLGYTAFRSSEQKTKLEYFYHQGAFDKDAILADLRERNFAVGSLGHRICKNDKIVTKDKELIRKEFMSSVLCYFPAYRYAIPDWEGEDYAQRRIRNPLRRTFFGELDRPIIVDNARISTPQWVEDVLIDSKSEIIFNPTGRMTAGSNVQELRLLNVAKENVEKILSAILEKSVVLKLGYRSQEESRLAICTKGSNNAATPSFDALSTGQTILADMFLTILRYADKININQSIRLEDIRGVVVVDEIDAHLHTDLQHKTLPRLLKLFPNVQFIVTAHSPLFVLGMEKEYGEQGFDLYELPAGDKIDAEEYREFLSAYEEIARSKIAKRDLELAVGKAISDVRQQMGAASEILIVTEGCTDWMHMEHAWKMLKDSYPRIKDKIKFYRYYPKGKAPNGGVEVQMSDSELVAMCEGFAKMAQDRPIVFISDADNPKVTKKFRGENLPYKKWTKGVYSFELPDPGLREGFTDVCIEHYYSDDALKTHKTIADVPRRLFLCREFNHLTGQTSDHKYFYENHKSLDKKSPFGIIEGDMGNRVINLLDDPGSATNLAMPKFVFAQAVLNDEDGFKDFDVEPFRKIFDIVDAISQDIEHSR